MPARFVPKFSGGQAPGEDLSFQRFGHASSVVIWLESTLPAEIRGQAEDDDDSDEMDESGVCELESSASNVRGVRGHDCQDGMWMPEFCKTHVQHALQRTPFVPSLRLRIILVGVLVSKHLMRFSDPPLFSSTAPAGISVSCSVGCV